MYIQTRASTCIQEQVHKDNKNIFNKNGRRYRDVKTQKVCEQGWEANIHVGAKIKQTTNPT